MTKDNFSKQAGAYSVYRPGYPDALYDFIVSHTSNRHAALDVATGNGQVAHTLSKYFDKVYATDISARQIENSMKAPNIEYAIASAEESGFEGKKFDLITVGQAAHWFNLPLFYDEVKRIIKPGGLLALFGYKLPEIDAASDNVIEDLYNGILGPFWDPERKLVDEGYETIEFPFIKIPHPEYKMEYHWTYEQVLGFLGTWSAVQHYKNKLGNDPLEFISEKLKNSWGPVVIKKISFPMFLLAAKIT
ncbi:MAG: class I SAM-dependent methyltransferase [Bacteroidota bacterium]|nr:class I SAM-dependent methyltransferase [Bacteroidota bacterium]